ncbi:LIM/homeobox protein Lhx2 [Blomia tropicalis]|nr:LIM/homeobox protein Lhx2 [Blomia tropicalis]
MQIPVSDATAVALIYNAQDRVLCKGDYYGISTNGEVYCGNHYGSTLPPSSTSYGPTLNQESEPMSPTLSTTKHLTDDEWTRSACINVSNHLTRFMNGSTLTSTETSASSRKRVRSSSVNGDGPKRVRTTFGQDQLSSLHECFKRTHKPNSVELRQLIHRTGLSKRVLQNQRSKWIRSMCDRAMKMAGPLVTIDPVPFDQLFSINLIDATRLVAKSESNSYRVDVNQ